MFIFILQRFSFLQGKLNHFIFELIFGFLIRQQCIQIKLIMATAHFLHGIIENNVARFINIAKRVQGQYNFHLLMILLINKNAIITKNSINYVNYYLIIN